MNLLRSIWNYKCPQCREGDLFKKPFSISNPLNMNEKCSHCSQSFEPEPGYWFGAMFISYIWTAWTCLFIMAVGIWGLGWSVEASFGALVLISALSYFFVLRISRSMYIHIDVRYKPHVTSK